MKRLFIILAIALFVTPALNSCREETVEVETLEPDANDNEEGFDTNPVSGDQE